MPTEPCASTRATDTASTPKPISWHGPTPLQTDAHGGYGELYREDRDLGPVLEVGCLAHARRKFFELADVFSSTRKKSRGQRISMIYPFASEAVQRLDALFNIERGINGKTQRRAAHYP